MRRFYEHELFYRVLPVPFLRWNEEAVRQVLKEQGFDLNKPIAKLLDHQGWCWVQKRD